MTHLFEKILLKPLFSIFRLRDSEEPMLFSVYTGNASTITNQLEVSLTTGDRFDYYSVNTDNFFLEECKDC